MVLENGSGPLGGNSPGRRAAKGQGAFPSRPADAKAKRGKVPRGVKARRLGAGPKRAREKKGCVVVLIAFTGAVGVFGWALVESVKAGLGL